MIEKLKGDWVNDAQAITKLCVKVDEIIDHLNCQKLGQPQGRLVCGNALGGGNIPKQEAKESMPNGVSSYEKFIKEYFPKDYENRHKTCIYCHQDILTHNNPVESMPVGFGIAKDDTGSVTCEHGVTRPAYCDECSVPFKRKEKVVYQCPRCATSMDVDPSAKAYEISEATLTGWIREWWNDNTDSADLDGLARFLKKRGV